MRRAACALGLTLLVLGGAACDVALEPWDLRHARVLAVRTSAPGLAPDEVAAIAVLVSDDAGVPQVVAPARVAALPVVPGEADGLVRADDAGGWYVQAPDAARLATMRADRGLAADADVLLTLAVDVEVDGATLAATKEVRLGRALPDLALPPPQIDGATPAPLGPGTHRLTLPAGPAITWRVSAGELADADDASASWTLTPDDVGPAYLVAIGRDEVGATAWQIVALTVDAP